MRSVRATPGRPVTRGLATLTVVMVLFFILAMAAAYTNRTLIVDQRSSANLLRASQALQAADAGIEWALTQLNGPRVTTTCASSTSSSDAEFRSRYLTLNPDNTYQVQLYSLGGVNFPYMPSCVSNAGTWTCSCPNAASPTPLLAPTADGLGQAFRVNFQAISPFRAGTFNILSQGCAVLGSGSSSCLSQTPQVDAFAQVSAWVGLVKALPYAPVAALTAGGDVTAITLTVSNGDSSTGLTVHSAGDIAIGTAQLSGPPGSGSDGRLADDPALQAVVDSGRLFESVFGMDATNYRRQPATVIVDCAAGCTSADLADPLARYPGRVVWIDGDLTLDAAGTIGSTAQPAMIVATGTVTVAAAVAYNGMLYANAVNWGAGADSAVFTGAVVSATTFNATVPATLVYGAPMLTTISNTYGSFVRVPGGAQYF